MNDLFEMAPLIDPSTVTMRGLLEGARPARNVDENKWAIAHRSRPRLYELFSRFAIELIHAGRQRSSGRMILHRVRWETSLVMPDINTATGEVLKVSDHHSPYLSRLFMEDSPEYEGFFRLKKVKVTNPAYGAWPEDETIETKLVIG